MDAKDANFCVRALSELLNIPAVRFTIPAPKVAEGEEKQPRRYGVAITGGDANGEMFGSVAAVARFLGL